MSIPSRLKDERPGTFFVSANAIGQRFLLQSDRMANLFIETLLGYRDADKFLVHEFTVMPNHIHVLLTPINAKVSDSLRLIKGGSSFRAGKEFGLKGQIWQPGFSEHCVRNADDYFAHKNYIWQNPVKARLVERAEDWPFCSASGRFRLDRAPEHLGG
jgi:putative transposase